MIPSFKTGILHPLFLIKYQAGFECKLNKNYGFTYKKTLKLSY